MNLTGQQLVDKGIITGPIEEDNIAQHGVDLNLIKVQRIIGQGTIPAKGKTILADREDVELDEQGFWNLSQGAYDITLAQGCKIPSNQSMQIVQRSSLLRNGSVLRSSLFDAGFYTDNIGTVFIVTVPIRIEYNARVAQIVAQASNEVINTYDGQWQNDKQRQ